MNLLDLSVLERGPLTFDNLTVLSPLQDLSKTLFIIIFTRQLIQQHTGKVTCQSHLQYLNGTFPNSLSSPTVSFTAMCISIRQPNITDCYIFLIGFGNCLILHHRRSTCRDKGPATRCDKMGLFSCDFEVLEALQTIADAP